MILIAEDNIGMRRMIRSLVEDLDPEIAECSDGSEAVEFYEALRPDVVLMDIGMKPVDGLTATRAIIERHAEARIIIVTQQQDDQTREAVMKLGAAGFVGKSDLRQLRELISGGTSPL